MDSPIQLLEQTLLFASLHQAHKEQIAQVMQRREFASGQVVFSEGEPGDALYVIEAGRVSVSVRNAQIGVDLEVARLGPGEVFGEMAVVTEEKRSATVKVVEPAVCWVLARLVLVKICEQLPQVSLAIARTLALRLGQLNREQGVSFATLASLRTDPQTYQLVPAQILQKHRMIPLSIDGNTLTLAMVDPGNVMGFDDVRRCLHGVEVKRVAISDDDYRRFIDRMQRQAAPEVRVRSSMVASAAGAQWQQLQIYSEAEDAAEDKKAASSVPGPEVVQLVDQILAEAIDREASDIHIDCERLAVHVRYRVDGQLVEREKPVPRSHLRPLVSRIKILSGMDIAEKRLPQDGRFSLGYKQRDLDVRVASMPVRGGERIAMRLLDASSGILEISNLILADKLAEVVRRMIFKPSGAVLVTGPTGSGKTTTLYSLLRERTRYANDLNIVTVEDPIEYSLSGIAQVEVHEQAGLGFPQVLRGFLRHDPNIIMVGETRDGVTGRIVMEAAITGHLVLTSMHTNSALGSVVRLMDMGVEPYMISHALSGVLSQRLVRRCCPMCSKPFAYGERILANLVRAGVFDEGDTMQLVRENGCENCSGTGFRGRVGVYEVLQVTETLRQMIAENAPMPTLRTEAISRGMVSMHRYAGFLLRNGLTVPSEVLRILSPED